MINKIKLIIISTIVMLFVSNANAAKDCSVFSHAIDIKICEAKNLQSENASSTASSESLDVSKATGFFKKIGSKLNLKKHKTTREQGD